MSRESRTSGFTLIEALVVLSILALVTSVAVPRLRRPSAALRVEAVAREMSADLRLLRARSLARNAETSFALDIGAKSYVGSGIRPTQLPTDLEIEMEVAASRRQGHAASIAFYPDGGSSGGTILLRGQDSSIRVDVSWLTGEAVMRTGDRRQ